MKKHSFKGGIHPLHALHEGKRATSGLRVRDFARLEEAIHAIPKHPG